MQQNIASEEFSSTTRDIKVSVKPHFLEQESNADEGRYAYAYEVTLENKGTSTVQLINRHWIVISGKRQIADVKGEGVVGQQPVLKTGDTYSYTSGTMIYDPVGAMKGSYTFLAEDGEFFDVEIPKFDLIHVDSPFLH